VLFTDGIPEAANEDDEFYSFERLEETLVGNRGANPQELLEAVMSDVRGFSGDHPQEDDITILVLKATESVAVAPVVAAERLITGESKSVTMLVAVGDDALPLPVVEEVNALMREHGSVVDALGDDTLVALFGVPVTHEDDAERAVTAAQAIQELDMPVTFRIGIDTGTAIIRSDEDIDYHEMGDTMRRSLHLANAAEPGQVLVSDRAHQLSRGAFQYAESSQFQPAEDEDITAYPLLASSEQPHRARGIEGLYAPMIGREREMEQLTACIDDLLAGRGGIVSISGEAGIGKTRLMSELKQYAGDKVQWLEGRCISYGQAMNYCPFRGIISSYLGILSTDTEEEMKAKLHSKVINLLPEQQRWAPIHVGNLFFPQYEAELLTASGDDYAKQYTYSILRNMFHRIADEKPLVMVFEDLHWSDPTSLAVLEFLMESVDEAPILYIWLYRPYRDSGIWRLREQADRDFGYCYTQIDLLPLQSEDTDALVSELLRIPDIPENMRKLVQDRASGNPLYVEEIIRSFIHEEAVVRDADYWRSTVESAGIVPSDTLQGVILARVDGLEPDIKEILQVASVVGERFPIELLKHVTESDSLSTQLRELERAQMLRRQRVGNGWEYQFCHPLIHDVVYQSLLPEDRETLHGKTGSAIEALNPEKLDDHTDQLAHHFGHSDNTEKALHYLILAGDNAYELKSYWEALDYYSMAMKRAEILPDSLHKKQLIVDLVIKRSDSRHWLGCLKEDMDDLIKYMGWVEALGDEDKITSFRMSAFKHSWFMGEGMHPELERYIEDPESIANYHYYSYFQSTDYETTVALIQAILERMADRIRPIMNNLKSTAEPGFLTFMTYILYSIQLAKTHILMGHWNESLMKCQHAYDLSTEYSQSTPIICSHAGFGNVYIDMGEWEKAIAECETALGMSPSGLIIPWVIAPLGEAYCMAGQLDKGISLLERWKAYARRVGRGPIVECEYCLPLAEGYLAQGNIDKAKENADEALHIALEKGYAFHEAKAYRILGEINAPTDFPSAEFHFTHSLEIMQRIKAHNEEGKTELSWGRACKQHGDVEQARTHLTRAAVIFEELGTTRYLEWTQEVIADMERSR
jgi:tetratricopeptide (TPR) repeat protein